MSLRKYLTTTGKTVFLGKSAETNEELIEQAKNGELLFHTSKPGSPFANIKSPSAEVSKGEIYEAAVMCAKHSQDWRDNKKDVLIHYFLSNDVKKEKDMKTGTFGVKKFKEIKVRKEDILLFEENIQK
jgi:predicted ribosome quality control (RQC) complex YloA/Tae2 family protein